MNPDELNDFDYDRWVLNRKALRLIDSIKLDLEELSDVFAERARIRANAEIGEFARSLDIIADELRAEQEGPHNE
jgi:hypothetical protein